MKTSAQNSARHYRSNPRQFYRKNDSADEVSSDSDRRLRSILITMVGAARPTPHFSCYEEILLRSVWAVGLLMGNEYIPFYIPFPVYYTKYFYV
jgi:hypothetical protein